jgi:hypothetical protein
VLEFLFGWSILFVSYIVFSLFWLRDEFFMKLSFFYIIVYSESVKFTSRVCTYRQSGMMDMSCIALFACKSVLCSFVVNDNILCDNIFVIKYEVGYGVSH